MLGIEQINQTVNMLDRVTQENAFESNQIKRYLKVFLHWLMNY